MNDQPIAKYRINLVDNGDTTDNPMTFSDATDAVQKIWFNAVLEPQSVTYGHHKSSTHIYVNDSYVGSIWS